MRPHRATGFTLIEILVVLVIIGVVLGFATLTVNPTGPGERLDTTSQQLVARARAAADEAILSGHTIGLQLGRHDYRFIQLTERGWQPIDTTDSPLRQRRLDDDIRIDRINGQGYNDGHNDQANGLTLPASPIAGRQPGETPESDRERSDDEAELAVPAALFLSSGELLPFTLEVSADGVDHRYHITGAPNGDITLARVER